MRSGAWLLDHCAWLNTPPSLSSSSSALAHELSRVPLLHLPTTMATTASPLASTTPLPLTLIVAATSKTLAIGRNGTLPWRLKTDMAFFARATKRVPTASPTPVQNAVIMGHKTYKSIPPKFRPLPDRLNVVLSRNTASVAAPDNVLRASGIEDAVKMLQARGDVGKVWVIGGAEIYRAALEWEGTREIVLTSVENEVEGCDTFFPVKLQDGVDGWKMAEHEELEGLVGEQIPKGVQEEGDWRFEFQLWRR